MGWGPLGADGIHYQGLKSLQKEKKKGTRRPHKKKKKGKGNEKRKKGYGEGGKEGA